ncbi:hypothetical protein ACIBF1_18980 [Spirillospora sp. NPDC050679]
MSTAPGHLGDDADGLSDGVEGRVMPMQCRTADVVRLPGHHPAVVILDDVPCPHQGQGRRCHPASD